MTSVFDPKSVIGQRLPALSCPSTLGGLQDLSTLDRAVVFVYPYAGRPGVADPPDWDIIPGAHGSTPQALGYSELAPHFADLGWSIFGLSGQSHDQQCEVAARLGLPFALLNDAAFAACDALGLPWFLAGARRFQTRITLLIEGAQIAQVLFPVARPSQNAANVLGLIRSQL